VTVEHLLVIVAYRGQIGETSGPYLQLSMAKCPSYKVFFTNTILIFI